MEQQWMSLGFLIIIIVTFLNIFTIAFAPMACNGMIEGSAIQGQCNQLAMFQTKNSDSNAPLNQASAQTIVASAENIQSSGISIGSIFGLVGMFWDGGILILSNLLGFANNFGTLLEIIFMPLMSIAGVAGIILAIKAVLFVIQVFAIIYFIFLGISAVAGALPT